MKISLLFTFLITGIFFSACSTSKKNIAVGVPPYVPQSQALHDTIVLLDSLLFDAYNTCKLDVFASLISEDIEFYHDRGGLATSKSGLVESIKNNICKKVRRELLKGSTEVHPIPNYGAVQISAHRFHNLVEKSTSRYSKVIQTWKREDGGWRATRIISLH